MWLEPSRVSQLPIHRESPRSSLIAQSNTYNFSGLLLPRHFLKHHTFSVLLTSTPQYYSSKIEQFPKHFEVFSSRTERTSVPGNFSTFLPFTKLPGGGAGAPRGSLHSLHSPLSHGLVSPPIHTHSELPLSHICGNSGGSTYSSNRASLRSVLGGSGLRCSQPPSSPAHGMWDLGPFLLQSGRQGCRLQLLVSSPLSYQVTPNAVRKNFL